jgi:hypothetical protein
MANEIEALTALSAKHSDKARVMAGLVKENLALAAEHPDDADIRSVIAYQLERLENILRS